MPKINPRAASSLQTRDDSSIRPESMSQASNQGAKSIIHGETPQPAQARRTVWIGSSAPGSLSTGPRHPRDLGPSPIVSYLSVP
jgi:hypothetical protein